MFMLLNWEVSFETSLAIGLVISPDIQMKIYHHLPNQYDKHPD